MGAADSEGWQDGEQALISRGDATMARARPRGRSIAISGANTFLGRSLVGLLGEDEGVSRIVVVDVENPTTAGPKTCFYELDLTQPGVDSRLAEILQAENVDTFVHLALLENPTQATAFAHELESVGTMRVLLSCHKQNVRRLVVVSSTLVYGARPDNPNYIDESRALRGLYGAHFIADKIDVEEQVAKYAQEHPGCTVTVLRMASVLGPTVRNYITSWLSRRVVPTALGYDPVVHFLHEIDALAALKLALDRNVAGVFNVASEGVLPLSTVIKLLGRIAVPVPYGLLRRTSALLWVAQLTEAPPPFAALMRYLCVVDVSRAARELGFRPAFSTRDAVLDFEASLRLREVDKLLGATT